VLLSNIDANQFRDSALDESSGEGEDEIETDEKEYERLRRGQGGPRTFALGKHSSTARLRDDPAILADYAGR
jgi:hypothetical protein